MFLLFLSGCSLLSEQNNDEVKTVDWAEHKQHLENISHWQISGKLAMFIGKERQSANLHWQQKGENFTIDLTSFIGTRMVRVKKDQQGVEIINSDGKTFTGNNAETLIAELAPGVVFPVSELQQWVKGNPVDASYQLNEQHLVNDLLGKDKLNKIWSVHLSQYKDDIGIFLPYNVELNRGDVRIKIRINQWQVFSG